MTHNTDIIARHTIFLSSCCAFCVVSGNKYIHTVCHTQTHLSFDQKVKEREQIVVVISQYILYLSSQWRVQFSYGYNETNDDDNKTRNDMSIWYDHPLKQQNNRSNNCFSSFFCVPFLRWMMCSMFIIHMTYVLCRYKKWERKSVYYARSVYISFLKDLGSRHKYKFIIENVFHFTKHGTQPSSSSTTTVLDSAQANMKLHIEHVCSIHTSSLHREKSSTQSFLFLFIFPIDVSILSYTFAGLLQFQRKQYRHFTLFPL